MLDLCANKLCDMPEKRWLPPKLEQLDLTCNPLGTCQKYTLDLYEMSGKFSVALSESPNYLIWTDINRRICEGISPLDSAKRVVNGNDYAFASCFDILSLEPFLRSSTVETMPKLPTLCISIWANCSMRIRQLWENKKVSTKIYGTGKCFSSQTGTFTPPGTNGQTGPRSWCCHTVSRSLPKWPSVLCQFRYLFGSTPPPDSAAINLVGP